MRNLAAVLLLLSSLNPCFAEDEAQKEATMVVKVSDLPPNLVNELETKYKLQQLGEYAGLGHEIGEGMNGALSAITDNTEKFANTRVGVFTMVLVAWKIMGSDLVQVCFGSIFFMFLMYFSTSYYMRNCRVYRYLKSEQGNPPQKTYDYREPKNDDIVVWWITTVAGLMIWALITFP